MVRVVAERPWYRGRDWDAGCTLGCKERESSGRMAQGWHVAQDPMAEGRSGTAGSGDRGSGAAGVGSKTTTAAVNAAGDPADAVADKNGTRGWADRGKMCAERHRKCCGGQGRDAWTAQAAQEPWVHGPWLAARRPWRVAEDPLDAWAVGEGAVIGAGVGAKLAGCSREGQCAHRWGREPGQCLPGNLGDPAGNAWMRQPGPGEGERRVARRPFRMA